MAENTAAALEGQLRRPDGQEDLVFAIYLPSTAASRDTAIVHSIIWPEEGDREVHGNVHANDQYVVRAAFKARAAGGGLALLHSHPGARGWQRMSKDDANTEGRLIAPGACALTGLPFVGLTLSTRDSYWSARRWTRTKARAYEHQDAESVRAVGRRLRVSFHPKLRPVPDPRPELLRTASVWGDELQADLARLRVGVVGLGSVGSLVAEALARMGVERLTLIDFDVVERKNRDRVLHTTDKHARTRTLKVDAIARGLRESATAKSFDPTVVPLSVVTKEGFAAALDCDIIFSCVDRPWPRHVLNRLAHAHLIPVIEGGIIVRLSPEHMFKGADYRAQTVGPGRGCLLCSGAYDVSDVATEMAGSLDDPHYLQGAGPEFLWNRSENVFPFSMALASTELMQFIALTTGLKDQTDLGLQRWRYYEPALISEPAACRSDCEISAETARGDRAPTGTGVPAPVRKPISSSRKRDNRAATPRRSIPGGTEPEVV